jgi:histidine triad (HIT) family protein
MAITKEEAEKIKKHLLGQLENFPEDKQEQITEQINSMTNEEVEKFIEQNKLTHLGGQCIFCSIVADKTPSHKIGEDKNAIAILELNPLSKGHTLIVPKEHLEKFPNSANDLLQEISKKIEKKFNPKEIKINQIEIMHHALAEIIPIYGDETERRQATEEELKEIKKEILKIKTPEIKTPEIIPILPPRIP